MTKRKCHFHGSFNVIVTQSTCRNCIKRDWLCASEIQLLKVSFQTMELKPIEELFGVLKLRIETDLFNNIHEPLGAIKQEWQSIPVLSIQNTEYYVSICLHISFWAHLLSARLFKLEIRNNKKIFSIQSLQRGQDRSLRRGPLILTSKTYIAGLPSSIQTT